MKLRLPRGGLHKRSVLFGVIGLVLILFVAATIRLFVVPTTNSPRPADAVVILGGSGARYNKGIALARAGYAPLLVVSWAFSLSPEQCRQMFYAGPAVQVVCFRPNPFTTQGEARYVGQLAKQRDLHTIIVVSGKAQTTRARLRVTRCFSGKVLMDPSPDPGGFSSHVYDVVYEWGALIKALTLQRSC